MAAFAEIGVQTVCFFPAHTDCSLGVPYSPYPPVWTGPGAYDWSSLDRQVSDIVAANPAAGLITMVDLNAPAWWVRLRGWGQRPDTFYELGRVAADEVWRRDTAEWLRAFLAYTEERHGERIVGYLLACGTTDEWYDCSRGAESVSRRAAWRQWMVERGRPDPIDIPPVSIREHLSHPPFRDPVDDSLAIDYWRFCHELIGETILHMAAVAQEVLAHRKPLGVFYGYAFELGAGRLLYQGHLDYERVFASPDLDWVVAPGPYMDRTMGGAGGLMQCVASLRHHGKTYLHEIDHRTHTSASEVSPGVAVPGHNQGWRDEAETIAGLRREFAIAAVNGASLWWFDMFGHWFEGPAVYAALRRMREIWDTLSPLDAQSAAEVLVVVDPESALYFDGDADVGNDLLYRQRFGLYRCGAPHDAVSFGDLASLDLTAYRLVLFPNLFVVDDHKLEVLETRVCRDGRTVVWVMAPGIIRNGRYDPEHIRLLAGALPGDEPVRTKFEGWNSVLVPQPNLSAALLRRLCASAGVHLYSDVEEPLYASRRLLACHTATGGERRFRLPCRCDVRELFTDRAVATAADSFADTLAAPDTVLYHLEPIDVA